MNDEKLITLCEDVAYIKAKIESLPCVDNINDLKNINAKLWFFSGITATISFLISFLNSSK